MSVAAGRFAAQLLTDRSATSAEQVAERLLAIQAQDPRGARLAIRSRTLGLHASDVDRALDDRSLVITTLNRGTLHLVRPDDYWWLQQLTTPQLASGSVRRLGQEGVPAQDAVRSLTVLATLLADGPKTRAELREGLAAAGLRVEGQAFIHQIYQAALDGLLVRGPMVGAEHAFVLVRDWLGKPPKPLVREKALALLARRYLAGHAPAEPRDLAKWAGITLGDARTGFEGVGPDLVRRSDGLAELVGAVHTDELPPPRLLGTFEPVLLGWTSRAEILGADQTLVSTNGIFKAFALVDGLAVGSWGYAGGKLTVTPFRPLHDAVAEALEADALEVTAFLEPRKGTP
jgi:hypothetical protein